MSVSKDLVDIIKGSDDKGTKAYDTPATVTRVDGSTVWVHIPGGVDETPVKKTINAKQGDTVQVRVSGGSAWLNGNASAPPTDDTQANVAVEYALVAGNAAESAVKSANIASEAAADAKATADSVHGIATQALADAATAKGAADNASEYAARALGNLSTVQSVTETLTWITQHGTMALTTDVALDPTHVYFVVDAGGDYVVGGVTYAIVTEPDVDDIGTYYELTIDESLNNYVGTHLALTSEGLWLLPASSGVDKVLIATGAGSTYTVAGTYIIDSSGATVASFRADGETIGISDGTQSYLTLDYHSMQSIDKESNAYFYVSDLRDASGEATLTYKFTSDGTTTSYLLEPQAKNTLYTVVVSDSSGGAITKTTTSFSFASPAPTNGATITVTYITTDVKSKAYTLGLRGTGNVGAMSVAEGYNCVADGYISHAEGRNTSATNRNSHAENYYTTASGIHSHAEGDHSIASGSASHAEGKSTASGTKSHAEGNETTASGNYSHAEGNNTNAGDYAHAEGSSTTASGTGSHAEGFGTVASATYSHASGYGTKAASQAQTALGKYNVEDSASKYSVIIGNGTADNARSNALTVDWSGNVVTAGDITVSNGTPPYYKITSSQIDLTESPPQGDAIHDQTVRHNDANGTRMGNIEVYRTSADVLALALNVGRNIGGSWTYNTISMRMDANGDMDYTIQDPSAFRDALHINAYGTLTTLSSALSLTTTAQKVPLTSFTGRGCSLSSNGIKVTNAGLYVVSGSVYVTDGFTALDVVHAYLYRNSTSMFEGQTRIGGTGNYYTTISLGPVIMSLSAGDVVYLYCMNQGGNRGACASRTGNGIMLWQIG